MLFMGHTCLKNQTRATAELNPPPLPRPRVATPRPHLPRAQTPFPPLFLRLLPFFSFRRSLRNTAVSRSPSLLRSVSFIRSRGNVPVLPRPVYPPGNLPATSREFYKTFHASLTASVSFPPTKQRILVWIEFLMEIPSGSRPSRPSYRRLVTFRLPRCSGIFASACDSSGIDDAGGASSSSKRNGVGVPRVREIGRRRLLFRGGGGGGGGEAQRRLRVLRAAVQRARNPLHFAAAGFRERRISRQSA